jgi:ketosteroid isomerase-like protein
MLQESEARLFAQRWVEAWNSHDLDAIMSHYAPHVVLTSPAAAQLLGDPSGTVSGKDALRRYFERGLTMYPNLKFELLEVMRGISSIVLYYVNQRGTHTGEYMELDVNQQVVRVVANYS